MTSDSTAGGGVGGGGWRVGWCRKEGWFMTGRSTLLAIPMQIEGVDLQHQVQF